MDDRNSVTKILLLVAILNLGLPLSGLYLMIKHNLGIYGCLVAYAIGGALYPLGKPIPKEAGTNAGQSRKWLASVAWLTCALSINLAILSMVVNIISYRVAKSTALLFYVNNMASVVFLLEVVLFRRYFLKVSSEFRGCTEGAKRLKTGEV